MRMRLGLSALLVAALAVTGCGSDGEAKSAPKPSASPSPTAPPGLEVSAPEAPSDQADTQASAIEFGRYLVASIQYANRLRDVTPLVALARDQARCTSCRGVSDYIAGLKKDQVWEDAEDVEVGRLDARRRGPGSYTVRGQALYPRISFVDIEGTEDFFQAPSRYRLSADLSWYADRNRWQVEDFAFVNLGRKGS